jgi:hypothetical protein
MRGVQKSDAVRKASSTKVKSDGVTVVGKIAAFHSGNFSQEFSTYKLKDAITLLLTKSVAPQPGKVRINDKTGLREALFEINIKDDKVTEYFGYHMDQLRKHGKAYMGPIPNLSDFWDEVNGKVAASVWLPIEDSLGNSPLLTVKLWKGDFPPDMRAGSVISVLGNFNMYIQIPKAQGAAVAKERAEEELKKVLQQTTAGVVTAPPPPPDAAAGGAADDDLYANGAGNSAVAEPRRHPTFSLSFSSFNGCTYHESNRADCTPFQAFAADFDHRRHFLRLPASNYDSVGFVVPISEYQNYPSWDMYEPGPSTARRLNVSLDERDYEKAPKGETLESTAVREEKKIISIDVLQYSGKQPDISKEFPWTLQFNVFKTHTMGTGITSLEQWLKFGRHKWQGVAVVGVDAEGTRKTELFKNNQNDASANQWAGHIECWAKTVIWDVESSVRAFGVPVKDKAGFLGRLYADIYQEAENKKTKTTIIQLPMDRLKRKFPFASPLNTDPARRVVNLNEWDGDAGYFVSNPEYELYVVLYLPIPPELLRDPGACEEYTEAAQQALRDLPEEDFVGALLGDPDATALPKVEVAGAKRDIVTYHADELACFAAIDDGEARAPAYPGRGTQPRVYADRNARSGAKPPASYGFDFLVYAVLKAEDQEEEQEHHVAKREPVASKPGGKKGGKK